MSNIQIIDNDELSQQGGNLLEQPDLININIHTDDQQQQVGDIVDEPDQININTDSDVNYKSDNTGDDNVQYGGNINKHNLGPDQESSSELIIDTVVSNIDDGKTLEADLDTLKDTDFIKNNEDVIDFDNKTNIELVNLDKENYPQILSTQSNLFGGSSQHNHPDMSNSTKKDESLDDNIMISIDDDNNVNVLEHDMNIDKNEDFINNDIKIINLK